MNTSKKILVAPLDWGIGHATRCIPLIEKNIREGHRVFIASNGRSLQLLKQRFSNVTFLYDLPDYKITYSKSAFLLHLFKQIPHILRTITAEHHWLERMIEQHGIDEVISDNRYGLYSKKITCNIITHQTRPIGPFPLEQIAAKFIAKKIAGFNHCLIPDFEERENSYSGKLSHVFIPDNARFIGPLSRFDSVNDIESDNVPVKFDFLCIISGPEPMRSAFENKIIKTFEGTGYSICIAGGKPESNHTEKSAWITKISFADDREMLSLIQKSRHIICRPGYSTLMDLMAVKRKAILIPTPGQSEQEYLGVRFQQKFNFGLLKEKEISIENLKTQLP